MKKFWLVFMGLGISLYSFSQIETDEEIVDTDTIEIALSDTIDNAIVYPESMEADLNNLLTDWYMQQYAVVDDSCLVNSVNVDYPDSVYIRSPNITLRLKIWTRLFRKSSTNKFPYYQISGTMNW